MHSSLLLLDSLDKRVEGRPPPPNPSPNSPFYIQIIQSNHLNRPLPLRQPTKVRYSLVSLPKSNSIRPRHPDLNPSSTPPNTIKPSTPPTPTPIPTPTRTPNATSLFLSLLPKSSSIQPNHPSRSHESPSSRAKAFDDVQESTCQCVCSWLSRVESG